MLTAPSTISVRAAMTAFACWRRSIALAISGRVGKVADPGLDDLDAGLHEPVLDLGAQLVGDLGLVDAQGDLALVVGVVRVRRGEVPQGRLGLDVDEVLVVVDLEQRLGRVGHLPDDDGGDLDRVAVVIVDLELGGLEVADAHGDRAALGERVHPLEALLADRAAVPAEEDEGACLVGVHRREADEPESRRE